MRKIIPGILFAAILLVGCSKDKKSQQGDIVLKLKWASERVFKVPESVLYDEVRDIIYVANINGNPTEKDHNGYISKLSKNGIVEELQWVTGLHAPKGMGIYQDKLYVTDISRIVEIDINRGKILKRYDIGGKFLNDITVDQAGNVYISDMAADRIYQLSGGLVTTWLEGKELHNPNGLLIEEKRLLMASKGSGSLKIIDLATKKIDTLASIGGSPDGLVSDGRGNYFLSSWNGEVFFISTDTKLQILDTRSKKINSADIDYIPEEKLLLVPTFFDNRVMAYEVVF
jgi:sugar lactone lactonase YvrE